MAAEALNPTIGGALIGASAGLIAVLLTLLGSALTLRASRKAAHEQRVWEKRAELYEVLLELTGGAMRAADKVSGESDDEEALAKIAERLRDIDVKTYAYASEAVWRRFLYFSIYLKNPPADKPDRFVHHASRLEEVIRSEMLGRRRSRLLDVISD